MVTDLPEPLSPTTPSSSPGLRWKLTLFTAWISPPRVLKTVLRSLTSRTDAAGSAIQYSPRLFRSCYYWLFFSLTASEYRLVVNSFRFLAFYQSRFAARFQTVQPAE